MYSGKFLREKTFAKTTNRKISLRKLSRIHTLDRIWVARACDVCEENFRERAQIREIRESFPLCGIIQFNAKKVEDLMSERNSVMEYFLTLIKRKSR